jgi:hypothetical protein
VSKASSLKHGDFGPLPTSDANAELQRRSLKALSALLVDQDQVVFRDQRTEDYGVDGSFELNIGGSMTNFRAHVQIKASACIAPNREGCVAFSVPTSNFNYLLNGSSPIYLLFDSKKNAFWYVWAQDESRRLEKENPQWRDQNSITLKFAERFTRETLNAVVDRVLREGRLHREIHDSLARSTGSEPVVISINAESLEITDPVRARTVVLVSGAAIVAAGYPKQALALVQLLESSIRDAPRVQLTAGYAEYTIGNYYSALGHVRSAMARSQELSRRDNAFLASLKDACEFTIGIIDVAMYQQRLTTRSHGLSGLEALEAQQDALYHEYNGETDFEKRADLAEKLRGITTRILNNNEANDAIKVGARLLLLYVEGVEANLGASQKLFSAEMRSFLFPTDSATILQNLQDARSSHSRWETQSEQALKDAYELSHPVLIVQALMISLNIRIGRLIGDRLDAISHQRSYAVSDAAKSVIQRGLDEALELNTVNGSVEGRLRLNKLQADLLEVEGDLDGARKLAAKVYPEALAMGFNTIAEGSRKILDGGTLLMSFERELLEPKEDDDSMRATQTDEQIARIARLLLDVVECPPARLEVLHEHVRSLREIARERCSWCRHIQILEDLSKTSDPRTAYSVLPTRKCLCARFGFRSAEASDDAFAVIAEFKKEYCTGCLAREPKVDKAK